MNKETIISIIITAHAEGNLINHTLASVERAISALDGQYPSETILHLDNPTDTTLNYIKNHDKTTLKNVRVFQNNFRDLGKSRNFAIKQATGKYIATIDADDLMSKNWLRNSIEYLEQHKNDDIVAHSEVTIEFEGANSIIQKHGEIDLATDTLLSVYANRWNSVIITKRSLLLAEPYSANSAGYGYEDWHLNCRLIARGIRNVLIPKTAIFVRRKKTNSEWLRQVQSMAVLRANPLLKPEFIKNISNPFASHTTSKHTDTKSYIKKAIKSNQLTHMIAKKTKSAINIVLKINKHITIPTWLKNEWVELHKIDKKIFPSNDLIKKIDTYDTISEDHKIAGSLYKTVVDRLQNNHYDYLLFVPWLIHGGADLFSINYANAIAAQKPDKRVLVIATMPVKSSRQIELDSRVDFLDFGNICNGVSDEIKHRIMGHIIENYGISAIHIINSEFGYDFVNQHETYIKATDKKIIATAFSQSVDREGRVYGYSHTHIPNIYNTASLITSDNQAVIDMWQNEYGFDSNKMLLHRQPIKSSNKTPSHRKQHKPLRVLWAGRIAPEKQPDLLSKIGQIDNHSFIIDIFGTVDPDSKSAIRNLPNNISYKGPYSGFASLPVDRYDVLLYTSLFDGMPNIILEAAQANLPIVASAVGGIPEFIINKKTGILVTDISNPQAYVDALKLLNKNTELGNKLAIAARKRLQTDFSVEIYKRNIKQMLKKINY